MARAGVSAAVGRVRGFVRRPILETWISSAKLNHRRSGSVPAVKRDYVLAHAPGKSYADIGCMYVDPWRTDTVGGDYAFLAEEVGATRVTATDGMDPGGGFADEYERRNSKIRFLQGDLHDPRHINDIGVHDVVLCAGLYYHTPNPFLQFEHLRRITGERILISGHTFPEVPGIDQACIWLPGVDARARDMYARVHRAASQPMPTDSGMGYAGYWWGITPSALRSMIELAGFDIDEIVETKDFMTYVYARPSDRPNVIPDPSFARERGITMQHNRAGWAPALALDLSQDATNADG